MAEELNDILRELANTESNFTGEPFYNAYGDCLVWYFCDRESFRERVDDKLTVYRALDDREIVGCQVKSVRTLLNKLGSFPINFEETGFSLEMLFYISHFYAENDHPTANRKPVYDRLVRRASGTRFKVPAFA